MKKSFSFKAAAAAAVICTGLLLGIFAGTVNLPADTDSVMVCAGGPGSVLDNY